MLHHRYIRASAVRAAAWALAGLILLLPRTTACTVFTIAGGEHVLFCNNEDFSNPNTRIWFIPAADTKNGCVFVGFDDGWGQGGLNSKGLTYGWVAGYKELWQRGPGLADVRGNSCQRMLESCESTEEAVAFFRRNWEESFSYGRLLVADRTGKSVILRAKDEKKPMRQLSRSRKGSATSSVSAATTAPKC